MVFGFHRSRKEAKDPQPQTYNRAPAPLPPQNGAQNDRSQQVFSVNNLNQSGEEPPSIFKRTKHAVIPHGASSDINDVPIQTNNFYNNLLLGDQTNPVWTQPYSLWVTKDPGQLYGLAFNQTDSKQKVFGPDDLSLFFFNPPKIKSWVISGEGLSESTPLSLFNHAKYSVTTRFDLGRGNITIPLVQGMGFVTSVFDNVRPIFGSQVGVQEFKRVSDIKYEAKLFNQVVWSIYVTGNVNLKLDNNNQISGDCPISATIQFIRGSSPHFDETAGTYQIGTTILNKVSNNSCEYGFDFQLGGSSRTNEGLVWLLTHHYDAIIDNSNDTSLTLDSTTKGVMRGYKRKTIWFKEDLPQIDFEPWAQFQTKSNYSSKAIEIIKEAAKVDIQDNVVEIANIDSMYTSGKILAKYALIAYTCYNIIKDSGLTDTILPKIKQAIEIFASNKQKFPLAYDTTWKGIISTAEPGADFGNSNYNDHHFHYGYHIHAIALVASIDKNWLNENNNLVLNYANTLIRDVASPQQDKFFPESRCFDWFHGHSWAHGIFPSGDGKNEESSSEDYNCYYGIKLYAKVIGDQQMEDRANTVLSIMKRSINYYMLFSNDNKVQPKKFIQNKVSGILFENKIDYTTFFGRGSIGDEWIHGIHMLPITPISSFIRSPQFVKEEWEAKLGNIIERIPDGWKGILLLNYALYDPKRSWKWFSRPDWDPSLIDNGMSRTWSLAFIAGIGGDN